MPITREDVICTARLARLKLADAEIERFGKDLARIAAYVEKLREVDIGDSAAQPVLPLIKSTTSLRDDSPRRWFTTGDALSGAPETQDCLFRVPKVIG